MLMSKLSLIFQIIKKSIFKPRLMLELAEEKSEIKDDEKFRKHEYDFDFESINDFFKQKYTDVNIRKFEAELNEIDNMVEELKTQKTSIDLNKQSELAKQEKRMESSITQVLATPDTFMEGFTGTGDYQIK